MQEFCKIS